MSYWEGGGAVGGVWLPGGGGGGPAIVQSVSGSTAGAIGAAVSFAAPVTAGNLLYVAGGRRTGGHGALATDFASVNRDNAIGPNRPFAFVNPAIYAEVRLGDIAGPDAATIGYRIATGDEQTLYWSRTHGRFTFYEIARGALGTLASLTAQGAAASKPLPAFGVAGTLSLGIYLWDTGDPGADPTQTVGGVWVQDQQGIDSTPGHPGVLTMHEAGYAAGLITGTAYEWGGVAVTI